MEVCPKYFIIVKTTKYWCTNKSPKHLKMYTSNKFPSWTDTVNVETTFKWQTTSYYLLFKSRQTIHTTLAGRKLHHKIKYKCNLILFLLNRKHSYLVGVNWVQVHSCHHLLLFLFFPDPQLPASWEILAENDYSPGFL